MVKFPYTHRRIKEARLAVNLSQRDLGERLTPSTTRVTVGAWEKGRNTPPASRIGQLAEILGVDPNFFYSDPPDTDTPLRVYPK